MDQELFELMRQDLKVLGEENEVLKQRVDDLEQAMLNIEERMLEIDGGGEDDTEPPRPTLRLIKGGKK